MHFALNYDMLRAKDGVKMSEFDVTMKHTEESLEALSHMQYDLFCKRNKVVRTLISVAAILLGVIYHDSWWSILVIAYGCYMTTSTYASANRTAHKIAGQIKAAGVDFPGSEYHFSDNGIHITPLPEKSGSEFLPYSKVFGLGEDFHYYYIFRDQYGGYMIPKEQLDENCVPFRNFIERKTGKSFILRRAPLAKLRARLRQKENEPYHL